MDKCKKCEGKLIPVHSLKNKTLNYSCSNCGLHFDNEGNEVLRKYNTSFLSDAKILRTFQNARKGLK